MNMKHHFRSARCRLHLTGILALLTFCGAATGQVSEHYDLHWSVLSGGGGVRASAASGLHDALGQSMGAVSNSAAYRIEGGFIVSSDGESGDMVHPADLNADWRLTLGETIAYLAGWQQGSNPIGYAIRAAFLWQNGERYLYNAEETPPLCWELTP